MKKVRINLPFDYIHDNRWSFGNLIIKIPFTNKWLAVFKKGLRITKNNLFHNCTATGIF